MEARIITNRQQWNEFVAGSEQQCNVTQSYEWGQLLATLDGEVFYVGVLDDQGKMCAAMLLLASHVSVSNSAYFYAPRGPIIDDPDSPAMTVLLNYVKALARKHHAFMLKIEPGVPDNDPKWLSALHRRGFVANPEALHLRHEWVLDIRLDEEKLLADMKKTWRYCIRLASRKNVTVRRSESPADIDTFYRILQTTSQRDTFMIYDKSFYEKLVELYGQSQNVALFIAEYEGQALGAALLVKMGRWCWYMYGASSNEHRDRMPNHLLQWTAMRWAKEQGCWYYNFRGIPDVLEESQPMWGVYLFKSGFGGYAMRSLETHDLPYNPLLYRLYRSWLDGRGWLKDVRARRHNKQLEIEKPEKQEKQSEQSENPSKTAATRTGAEPKQTERNVPMAEKQPKQPKPSREQNPPRSPRPSQAEQQSTPLPQNVANLTPRDAAASNLTDVSTDVSNLTSEGADASNPTDVSIEPFTPTFRDADASNPTSAITDVSTIIVNDVDVSNLAGASTNPSNFTSKDANASNFTDTSINPFKDADASNLTDMSMDASALAPENADATVTDTSMDASPLVPENADATVTDVSMDASALAPENAGTSNSRGASTDPSTFRGAALASTDPIYGEGMTHQAQSTESAREGTTARTNETTEEILQQIIGSTGSKTEQKDTDGGYARLSRINPMYNESADFDPQMQPTIEQRNEAQPAPNQSSIEAPMEHLETKDEPPEIQVRQPGFDDQDEHVETRDENVSTEPEAQPDVLHSTQEERENQEDQEDQEDQDAFNEETQKLPRIQMAQKYSGTRRPGEQDDAYKRDGMNGTGGHTN